MAGSVRVKVSKKNLEFTPDTTSESFNTSVPGENEFDVIVVNDSDKFASFQLELSTPGVEDNPHRKWYVINPEICAKKPPGSETKFHVAIVKAPIPVYDTTIDLILKVISVEYENLYASQKLKLTINKPLRSLRVELPIKEHKVTPGDTIEIPVIVYNLSPKLTEITLTCSGLDSDWMTEGRTRELLVEPGDLEKMSFVCQPPKDTQTRAQEYKFTIDAKSNTSQYTTREQGILEVLPDGVVEFSCSEKQQTIPGKRRKQSHTASYEMVFKNESNLPQQVNITIPQQEQKQWMQTVPESVNLAPAETKTMYLVATKQQHWIGRVKKYLFEVSAGLTHPKTGEASTEIFPSPNTQVLELTILPVIPFLLQVGGGALILLLLLLNWLLRPQVKHTGAVNSVRLFGNGSLVVSGSSDQTIRLWQVDNSRWQLDLRRLKYEGQIAPGTKKAVRVIRQSPKDNDVVAAGLDSGDIQLWNISERSEQKPPVYKGTDRVFDLVFAQDSRSLFSGHGSGLVHQWNLKNPRKNPINTANVKFTIYALTISESQSAPPLVIAAGRYNKIAVWDWVNKNIYELPYQYENSKFTPVVGQQHYITSLASANNILAIADNHGYITLGDMKTIRACINKDAVVKKTESSGKLKKVDVTKKQIVTIKPLMKCNYILGQSVDGHSKQPVRSVALTQNGKYLASAGDDKRVMLWSLEDKPAKWLTQGQVVAQSDARLNSVDIKALKDESQNYLLVTTGDDNHNVQIYRVNGVKNDASSK
ncbi:hypothetical protein NUACC21_64950 [Scytonema sp. NUACC21]